jgi:hypothetical protein
MPASESLARRVSREPLLHFLLIGALIFAAYGRLAPDEADLGPRIVASRAVVDDLARQHRLRFGRLPTDAEMERLVEAWVRDEVQYREGVALGLDRDDPVIKRRVRQKLEVITEELLAADAPTDAQLAEHLARNAERYRRAPKVAFEQVLLDAGADEDALGRAVAAAREALARGVDPATVGRPTLLPHRVGDTPIDLVGRDFGAAFADHLASSPVGEWSGPVRSGYGVHLVRVTALGPAQAPPLEAIRTAVARDWENERRTRSAEDAYRRMRARYEIVVEPPSPATASAR